MGAVVSLGGCSALFVSPEGLIVTNHHCVQASLQYNSTPDRNLMVDGFLARTKEEELWNGPGSRVYVTVSVRDVTEQIMGNIDPQTTDRARYDIVNQRIKAQTAACEKDGLRCTVASFFEGLKWFEIGQLEIQDVRLVYAPRRGSGTSAARPTTGSGPGTPATSPSIAPTSRRPESPSPSLKKTSRTNRSTFSRSPRRAFRRANSSWWPAIQAGRLACNRTPRSTRPSSGASRARSSVRPIGSPCSNRSARTTKTRRSRVARSIRGLNNGLTKNKGVLQGMLKGGLLAAKETQEKAFVAWIAADPTRQAKCGGILPAIHQIGAERTKTRERDALLGELAGVLSSALSAAQTLYRFAIEKPKPDADRDAAYQERNWSRLKESQERAQRTLSPKADRALMKYTLAAIANLPAEQRIEALDRQIGLTPGMSESAAAQTCDAWLDRLYAGTKIYDQAFRMSLFDKSAAEIVATQDSMLLLAAALYPLEEANREESKERAGAIYRLGPPYAEALLAHSGGLVAPDANSTLRVAYGTVKGVEPRDGLFYLPQTTLKGILEKATGSGEFNAPQAQLDAIRAVHAGHPTRYLDPQLKDVPVDFLSNVDSTGGNSGSATLNSQGELVGLLFDGTFDTVASDYLFDRDKTRSIHVDSRNMLWVMTEVDKATNLLREMGFAAE